MERRIDRLHWKELKKIVPEKVNAVILPVGILEAHAASALGTDNFIPEHLAGLVAPKVGALVAPTIPYGVPGSLEGYPGTVGVRREIFADYVQDVLHGLAMTGFHEAFILNGHGGNTEALKEVAQAAFQSSGLFTAVIHWWLEAADITREVYGGAGGHGGADETGLMLAIDPALALKSARSVEPAFRMRAAVQAYPAASSLLVYGDDAAPLSFDATRARTFLAKVTARVEEIIEEIQAHWSEI